MAIASLDDLKAELSFAADLGAVDDGIMNRKLTAAENFIERELGFKFSATYGGIGQDPVPPALQQAVLMLAAHWYENREVIGDGREMPFSVRDILSNFRDYSF